MIDLQKQQDCLNLKQMLKYVISFVFAIIVFGLSIELCIRVEQYLRFGAPIFGEYHVEILRADGKNVPNAQFEKWKNNNLGFRGPDITVKKPEGKIRVACIGASETYGLYESPDKEWPAQLRDLLPAQYEVVNTAVVGLSLKTIPYYMKKHVFPIEPDIIVIVASPLFMIAKQNMQIIETVETINEKKQEAPKEIQRLSIVERLIISVRVIEKTKQLIKQLLVKNFPFFLQKIYSMQLAKFETETLKGMKPFDSAPEADLKNLKKAIEQTIYLVTANDSKLIFCTYPALISNEAFTKYPEKMLGSRRFHASLSIAGMRDSLIKGNEIISDTSLEKNVAVADVAKVIPQTSDYFEDSVHYTDNGARLFAETVAAKILSDSEAR